MEQISLLLITLELLKSTKTPTKIWRKWSKREFLQIKLFHLILIKKKFWRLHPFRISFKNNPKKYLLEWMFFVVGRRQNHTIFFHSTKKFLNKYKIENPFLGAWAWFTWTMMAKLLFNSWKNFFLLVTCFLVFYAL